MTCERKFLLARCLLAQAAVALLIPGLVLGAPSNSSSQKSSQTAAAITFFLFATDMSGCDSSSDCDLFVVINCASGTSGWTECGKTSKRQGENAPVWPEVFTFQHNPGTLQRWRFDIKDADVAFDDTIATLQVNVDEYEKTVGNLYQIPISGKTGVFWIHRSR